MGLGSGVVVREGYHNGVWGKVTERQQSRGRLHRTKGYQKTMATRDARKLKKSGKLGRRDEKEEKESSSAYWWIDN